MTPMFDEMDKVLREALASEALPSDGFADRVMARVAETPQQRKASPAARKWLVTAAACLVVAAALIPLLHSGGLYKGNNMQAVFSDSAAPGSDTAPAAADENSAERLAPDNAMDGATPSDREAQQKSDTGKDVTGGCPDGENLYTAAPAQTMDEALARAAETLEQQGFVLAVTAREESAVRVLLTDAAGSAGDPAVLDAAMEAEGFTAADNNWYTYEEDINS
ncbi:MAG: hypothetical protein UDO37_08730 [Oscillospiraceae bacterium]|jgi:hypothetical protein|nr:hypothetical protein [Oscillospiraceae bacterium]